ncbi:hypothetical protein EJK53_0705 [Moraxella catarrhalis]|uniref:Uncharacterized protein n=1 Tax=Moraxella catarrhalis TaxID=480 RepID=A0A3Q9GDE4_MORCA|nr:hypothetical protein EJK53_0705 [Moraxella catarrhalis]
MQSKKQVLKPVFLDLLVGFYQKKRLTRSVFYSKSPYLTD